MYRYFSPHCISVTVTPWQKKTTPFSSSFELNGLVVQSEMDIRVNQGKVHKSVHIFPLWQSTHSKHSSSHSLQCKWCGVSPFAFIFSFQVWQLRPAEPEEKMTGRIKNWLFLSTVNRNWKWVSGNGNNIKSTLSRIGSLWQLHEKGKDKVKQTLTLTH